MTMRKSMPMLIRSPPTTVVLVFFRHALVAKYRLYMASAGTGHYSPLSSMRGLVTESEMFHLLATVALKENSLSVI